MDKNALSCKQDMESNKDRFYTVWKKQKKQQLAYNLELFKIKGDGYLSTCQGDFYVFFIYGKSAKMLLTVGTRNKILVH